MRLVTIRRLGCLSLLVGVAGCAGLNDPFEREGTWRPQNVNDANIAVMVANTNHLTHGANDDATPGALSAAAVHRLLTDHVKPLTLDGASPLQAAASTGGSGSTGQ
jgi:hypothetical protein